MGFQKKDVTRRTTTTITHLLITTESQVAFLYCRDTVLVQAPDAKTCEMYGYPMRSRVPAALYSHETHASLNDSMLIVLCETHHGRECWQLY